MIQKLVPTRIVIFVRLVVEIIDKYKKTTNYHKYLAISKKSSSFAVDLANTRNKKSHCDIHPIFTYMTRIKSFFGLFSAIAKPLIMTALLLFVCLSALCFISCSSEKSENMNATVQTILTRKSVRQFTAEPITEAQIDTLLRCAMAAPSAVNSQPWDFIVVTDRSLLDTIGTRYPNTRISSNVQVAIVPCGNMQKTFAAAPDFWIDDLSAATENLLLAAHSMGLGAVWCGIYHTERVAGIQQILGLPEYIVPLCIVPIGHPAEDPEPKDKFKTENIHYNCW